MSNSFDFQMWNYLPPDSSRTEVFKVREMPNAAHQCATRAPALELKQPPCVWRALLSCALPPRRMELPVPAALALPLVADHPDEARLAPSEWEPGFLEGEGLHPEVYIYIYIYIYTHLSLFFLYIYIYIYTNITIIYIYIYIGTSMHSYVCNFLYEVPPPARGSTSSRSRRWPLAYRTSWTARACGAPRTSPGRRCSGASQRLGPRTPPRAGP